MKENNFNNNHNWNRKNNENHNPAEFYDYLKKLETRESAKEAEKFWDNVTVTLSKNEIKRMNLIFALLRAHGVSPYYTADRWMGDVIEKALKDLDEYLLRVDGIDASKVYCDLRKAEEKQKERQQQFFERPNISK